MAEPVPSVHSVEPLRQSLQRRAPNRSVLLTVGGGGVILAGGSEESRGFQGSRNRTINALGGRARANVIRWKPWSSHCLVPRLSTRPFLRMFALRAMSAACSVDGVSPLTGLGLWRGLDSHGLRRGPAIYRPYRAVPRLPLNVKMLAGLILRVAQRSAWSLSTGGSTGHGQGTTKGVVPEHRDSTGPSSNGERKPE